MMEQLDNGTNIADLNGPVYFIEQPVVPEGFSALALPLLINRDMTTILYNGKTYAVIPEEDETANEDGEKSNPERREDLVPGEDASDDFLDGYDLGVRFATYLAKETTKEEVVGSNDSWDGCDQSEGSDDSQGYVDGFTTGYQLGTDFGVRLAKENGISKASEVVVKMPKGLARRLEDVTEALRDQKSRGVVTYEYTNLTPAGTSEPSGATFNGLTATSVEEDKLNLSPSDILENFALALWSAAGRDPQQWEETSLAGQETFFIQARLALNIIDKTPYRLALK